MQPIASYLLHHQSPLCPPAWRWGWGQRVVGDGRPWPDDIDHAGLATLRLAQHVVGEGGGTPGDIDGQLTAELAALAIYRGEPTRRMLAEAWILSGQCDAEVGQRLGIEPAVVGQYERLFFNVRDRLHARDWIIFVACDCPVDPREPHTLASVVRLLAYIGGPLVLDVVLVSMGMSTGLSVGHPLRAVDEAMITKVRLLVDVLTNPPRGRMAIRLWGQLREIEARRPKAAASPWHQTRAEVDCVLEDLDWSTLDVPDAAEEAASVMRHPATA